MILIALVVIAVIYFIREIDLAGAVRDRIHKKTN